MSVRLGSDTHPHSAALGHYRRPEHKHVYVPICEKVLHTLLPRNTYIIPHCIQNVNSTVHLCLQLDPIWVSLTAPEIFLIQKSSTSFPVELDPESLQQQFDSSSRLEKTTTKAHTQLVTTRIYVSCQVVTSSGGSCYYYGSKGGNQMNQEEILD